MLRFNLTVIILIAINICYSNAFNKMHNTYTLDEPYSPRVFDIASEVSEEFITQRLDNFDPQNKQTFEMVGHFVFILNANQFKIRSMNTDNTAELAL